jgi:DNA-directed RNA polymerase subunit RPC12/RpoP
MKCLICGKEFGRVCRHAQMKHGVSAREYKEMFGLDVKKGILSDDDRKIMKEHAKKQESHKNFIGKGEKYWFKKGVSVNYTRSEETMKRLKKHIRSLKGGHPPTVDKIEISCVRCGKKRMIYPRHFKPSNNFCGVVCSNITKNNIRYGIPISVNT